MTVYEPATLVTDCLLAALAGWFAWRLHASMPSTNLAVRWWSRALAMTAVSALVGGSYHGFAPNLPESLSKAWWMLALLAIGMLSAAMDLSLLHEFAPTHRQKSWQRLVVLKLSLFSMAVIVHPLFAVAIIDYGITMLAWAMLATASRRAWRSWMLVAICLSFAAAAVQQSRWSPLPHFNHNDIYHVIQALALIGFYRAGRNFGMAIASTHPTNATTPAAQATPR
jgi:hypothetical protein